MKFDVIVVDPPWAYGSATGRPNRVAEAFYKTVGNAGKEVNRRTGEGVSEIAAAAPVTTWAAEDSHLYLWTTNPKLPFAFELMRLWGFDYKTTLTWVKTARSGEGIRNGMGFFFRGATEHVLLGTRGRLPIPPELREPNFIEEGAALYAERGRHSEKPDKFYALLDRVLPGLHKLDVFARGTRPGWHVWGNEVLPQPVHCPVCAGAGLPAIPAVPCEHMLEQQTP